MIHAVIADTGPLYAGVDPSDEHHSRSRRDSAWFDSNGVSVLIPVPVLTEAYSFMLYRLGQPISLQWIAHASAHSHVAVPHADDLERAIAVLHRFSDQTITLVDALVHVMSVRLDAPIWTYDHHFDILRANRWHPEIR